jgi:hypothetical protein
VKSLALFLFATLGLLAQGIASNKNQEAGHDPLLQAIADQAQPCADQAQRMRELRIKITLQLEQGSLEQGALYSYVRYEADFKVRAAVLKKALEKLDRVAEKSPSKLSADAIGFRMDGEAELKAAMGGDKLAIEAFKPRLAEAWQKLYGTPIPKDALQLPRSRERELIRRY